MTSIIGLFAISFLLSMSLTPGVIHFAKRYRIVDMPSPRKVHLEQIPRAGGIAIYLAFFLSFSIAFFYPTLLFQKLLTHKVLFLALGGSMAFFLGLWDDVKQLPASVKFLFQIGAAVLAYWAGIRIEAIYLTKTYAFHLGWLSMPMTVFWFLLVMNAVNLIDGLDGLAAGLSLFVSLVLLIVCITTGQVVVAALFAALGGATLGFLRYNFNPAAIFMGDCGSYFLGYMLAALSIMGSLKGPATVALLIPVIALGLPLIDTLFSPVRRFVLGQKLFSPDRKHLHHRLIDLGFTQKNAVLFLYGVSIVLGIIAVGSVHATNEQIAVILLVVAGVIIFGIRKLGYVNRYFGIHRMRGWLRDVGDEMGISWERRSFLNLQIEIFESKDVRSLWDNITHALDVLGFDMAEMYLEKKTVCNTINLAMGRLGFEMPALLEKSLTDGENPQDQPGRFLWRREGFDVHRDVCKDCLLKMELPLIDETGQSLGSIWLIKDLCRDAISHYTLRRVEHLRRSVLGSLQVLMIR